MARFALNEFEAGFIGTRTQDADIFYDLGMMYATGRSVETDLVAAHKWFNLAAVRGRADAKGRREELAGEMSSAQIAQALKAARSFIAAH